MIGKNRERIDAHFKDEVNISYYKTEDNCINLEQKLETQRNQADSPSKITGDVGSKFFKSNLYSAASAIRKKEILIPIRQKAQ